MDKNNNLFYASAVFGVFYFPFAALFYAFSGKSLTYVSNRLYRLLITLRHGDWYEDRLRKTIEYLDIDDNTRVLEVGCGAGKFSKRLLGVGAQLKAIDINKKFIHKLKQHNEETFELCSVTDLKYPDAAFDRVVMFDVLHHLPEYEKALNEIRRVLKPNGYAIIWEGSETLGEEKLPPKFGRALLTVFDGEVVPLDIDAVIKKFGFKQLEPYCFKLRK